MPEVGVPCDPQVFEQECSYYESEESCCCNGYTKLSCLFDSMTGEGKWTYFMYVDRETNGETLFCNCYCIDIINAGILTSENFPSNYPNNIHKDQTMKVATGNIIMLHFTDFSVESESLCRYDYLTINDGDGTILLDKTCGYNLPQNINSRTETVHIVFHTDVSVVRSGWRIEWSSLPIDGGEGTA